jgi:hypothetical protein
MKRAHHDVTLMDAFATHKRFRDHAGQLAARD